MQYPSMRGGAQYRVEIPQLSGGVNMSDLPTQVADNQLVALDNMWWHQGALRTRPGLKKFDKGYVPRSVLSCHYINDREAVCVDRDGNAYSIDTHRGGVELGGIDVGAAATVLAVKTEQDGDDEDSAPYLFFVDDGRVYQGSAEGTFSMKEAKPYVPWVTVERRLEDGSPANVTYESFNMLTGDFRSSFSTDGERTDFKMPIEDLTKAAVTVAIRLYNSETRSMRTVSATITPSFDRDYATATIQNIERTEVFPDATDGGNGTYAIACTFDWVLGEVTVRTRVTSNGAAYEYPLPTVASNNIEVTARKTQEGQKETITGMTKAVWFGGARSGLGGGTRLFLTGNPKKTHLVCWSDVNNPLYFPENNYFYVGDADQAVTAFGKQGDLLVIFKEHEVHCTQYVAGSSFTSDDLISGNVTDIAALAAQFPLTPIHPSIGCDCPDTIRLVNNRLVWATSDAHVYMMPSVNQYSERNVRDITACVRRSLEQHGRETLAQAIAAEYKGYYMLVLPDGTAYALDVGNSAFQSYTYYASEKKANRALPWYVWSFAADGKTPLAAVSTGDELCLLLSDGVLYKLDGEDDDGTPIPCSFTTKLFDFGRSDKLKALREMNVRVGCAPNSCVRLSYMTEDATFEDIYRIEPTDERDVYDAGYIRSYRVTPNVNRARVFALRCDSDGAMAVEGIQMIYAIQGVIR